MAKNDYKNVEKVRDLLGDQQLGGLRKRLSSTEKSLNEILKKLGVLEAQKAEYSYYQNNVKPKPDTAGKKGYVCKICGYVHEGELPDDFVCPLCLHPASDFEPIK